jgi:hypothetical protein
MDIENRPQTVARVRLQIAPITILRTLIQVVVL